MSSTTLPLLALSFLVSFAHTFRLDAAETWVPEKIVLSVPLPNDGRLITVPVSVARKTYDFLVDTGCTHTILDDDLVVGLEALKETARVSTAGSDVEMRRYKAPLIAVGTYHVEDLPEIKSIDLDQLAELAECRFKGVLGMDILKRFQVHLDFDNQIAILADSGNSVRPPGASTPFTLDDNLCPCILVVIAEAGQKVFRLDLGETGTGTIERTLCDELVREGQLAGTGLLSQVIGADRSISFEGIVTCPKAVVAGIAHPNLMLTAGKENSLGLYYLCRHRVTFDFIRGRLHLEPGKLFAARDRSDYDGIGPITSDRIVESVVRGSIVERAGVRGSDKIVSLGASDASKLSLPSIYRTLKYPRVGELVIKVRRDGRDVEVVVPGETRKDRVDQGVKPD